jgi:methyltransferase
MVRSVALYLGGLALLAGERLLELAIARRNARRAFAEGAVEVGQVHFRVMTVIHTLFLGACAGEVLLAHRPFPGTLGAVALVIAIAAQCLRYWAITTLGERWNVRIIVLPHAAPVTTGPYRFVRHPNYLAVILEIAAVPLIHGAWVTAIAFTVANAVLLGVRIRSEEAALGRAWAQAFDRHPRFVPRVRPEAES